MIPVCCVGTCSIRWLRLELVLLMILLTPNKNIRRGYLVHTITHRAFTALRVVVSLSTDRTAHAGNYLRSKKALFASLVEMFGMMIHFAIACTAAMSPKGYSVTTIIPLFRSLSTLYLCIEWPCGRRCTGQITSRPKQRPYLRC